jgi:hypothetical protein
MIPVMTADLMNNLRVEFSIVWTLNVNHFFVA